jgi:hypothetical protein
MKYLGFGLLIILLMSGCVRRVRHIPMEPLENNETNVTGTLYDTSQTEARYNLKPEPYSVSSNEKDPELLGPQRTIEPTKEVPTVAATTETPTVTAPVSNPSTPKPATPKPTLSSSMSKSECISMIGQAKFDRYSKRFGGESGAIKRCTILKKLKG